MRARAALTPSVMVSSIWLKTPPSGAHPVATTAPILLRQRVFRWDGNNGFQACLRPRTAWRRWIRQRKRVEQEANTGGDLGSSRRQRRSSPARRTGSAMASRADDAAGGGDQRDDRAPLWPRRV